MKESHETRVKEKMMDFSRRFEEYVAKKNKDEAPYDVMVKKVKHDK